MANYVISEEQKQRIEEWFENYIKETSDDLGDEYDAANQIVFEFKYLKPLPWQDKNLNRFNKFIK